MTISLVTTIGTVSRRLHQKRRRKTSTWSVWSVWSVRWCSGWSMASAYTPGGYLRRSGPPRLPRRHVHAEGLGEVDDDLGHHRHDAPVVVVHAVLGRGAHELGGLVEGVED